MRITKKAFKWKQEDVEELLTCHKVHFRACGIDVKLPDPELAFMVHPDLVFESMTVNNGDRCYTLIGDKGHYPWDGTNPIWNQFRFVRFYFFMDENGTVGFWPVEIPVGTEMPVPKFDLDVEPIISIARKIWVNLTVDEVSGEYKLMSVLARSNRVSWPDKESYGNIVEAAFSHRVLPV